MLCISDLLACFLFNFKYFSIILKVGGHFI